jgi:hypothetical protein
MRSFKSVLSLSLFLLCFVLFYCGCQKNDTSVSHAPAPVNNKVTTMTIYSPEYVVTKNVITDSPITSFKSLAALLQASPPTIETTGAAITPVTSSTIYEGYTKTYDCGSNNWTYVYMWSITEKGSAPSGSGQLTVGTFSTSAAFVVVGTAPLQPGGTKYYIHYTLTVPNDANYCSSTSLTEMISFTFTIRTVPVLPPITESGGASNSESADPNVYQTYPDVVGGFNPNGDGTFTIDVAPGVLACQTECHVSALGFPPTVYFYYHLVGSSAAWSVASQPGNNLNLFTVQVSQAGTYEYYTQEDISPGVLSGEISYGTIAVQ